MRPENARKTGIIVALVALAVAAWVTFFPPFEGGLERGGDSLTTLGGPPTGEAGEPGTYRALYKTVNLIQKHYLDPARIDSRGMLVAAVREIQGKVAEFLAREDGDALVVRLGADTRRFPIGDVTTPWIMLQRARDILDFVRAGIAEKDDLDFQDIEYAAIGGLLSTLDPHSSLLTPDVYRDMKDKTQGKFGGLGIVISLRDGVLTVISPIDGTPAAIAGLQAGDQIVEIDGISTVSMPLNDAVTLLRGEPGSSVKLQILRKGFEEPKAFDIVRAIIEVKSVESLLLPGDVGYVRIKDFQGNTTADLARHLADLSRQGARALVLDLRNNPGGLLEAAIDVSDLFLDQGVIVTTAGQGPAMRDVRRARPGGLEHQLPTVILVNGGSASASEIVAGALKAHGRALVVGQQTFGKGSVQVLYDYNDGSALKLTTAQYLTPGDVSIQGIGIVPAVELLPMRADDELLDLVVDSGYRETDLEHTLEEASPGRGASGKPDYSLRYLWTPRQKSPRPDHGNADDDGADGEAEPLGTGDLEPEDVRADWEIDLARELAIQLAGRGTTDVDPVALQRHLDRRSEREQGRLAAALSRMGVDWTAGDDGREARVEVRLRFAEGPIAAGSEGRIDVVVTNHGPGSLHRLLAVSRSDQRALDDRELAFGRVPPGRTVERSLEFKLQKDALSRVDDVAFSFSEAGGRELPMAAGRLEVTALERPRFAYAVQVSDTANGNGDGRIQVGERVELVVDIENTGRGNSLSTFATLRSLSGNEVFLRRGREQLEELPAGERRQVRFEFEIKPGFAEQQARFELAVMDVSLRVYA
ncbi:MAG TPA: MXAN_5808 family serine peptidase, partial [Polyangia bacterium]|nr:MXAN_5808 family serine peptidase [Polyangia bacterium]